MRSIGIKNHRLGFVLAAALGTFAMLALPGLAAAKARDRNHDHIPDRWEKRHRLSLRVNQAHRNQDHEGLNNRQEFLAGTNPRDPDTDNDGITDGQENAGTIESFEGGVLTINLFNGGSVSGTVNEETEIECHNGDSASASDTQEEGESSENDGEEQQADENDSGNQEAGDDDAAEAEFADDGEGQESEDENGNCTIADLAQAAQEHAVVKEAELNVSNGEATFETIELAD